MDAKAEKIALFRYGLIAPLVLEALPRGELTRRAEEIAARQYEIPGSQRTSISVDTLLDWALRYRNGGFEALAPQPRLDRGKSRTITPQLADLIERLKRENPHRTGTTLLRELALSSGRGTAGISASTLYRFLKQRGLSERQLLAPSAHKRFEAEHSNQIWQSATIDGCIHETGVKIDPLASSARGHRSSPQLQQSAYPFAHDFTVFVALHIRSNPLACDCIESIQRPEAVTRRRLADEVVDLLGCTHGATQVSCLVPHLGHQPAGSA